MQRQHSDLVPISEVASGLDETVKAIREASPQALHHFTQADQVNQLVGTQDSPHPGFLSATASARVGLSATRPRSRSGVARRGMRPGRSLSRRSMRCGRAPISGCARKPCGGRLRKRAK